MLDEIETLQQMSTLESLTDWYDAIQSWAATRYSSLFFFFGETRFNSIFGCHALVRVVFSFFKETRFNSILSCHAVWTTVRFFNFSKRRVRFLFFEESPFQLKEIEQQLTIFPNNKETKQNTTKHNTTQHNASSPPISPCKRHCRVLHHDGDIYNWGSRRLLFSQWLLGASRSLPPWSLLLASA